MGIRPPPRALANTITSGVTPSSAQAKSVAGTPQTGLDFIEDGQYAMAGTKLLYLPQVALGRLHNAPFSLNGLDDEGCRIPGSFC